MRVRLARSDCEDRPKRTLQIHCCCLACRSTLFGSLHSLAPTVYNRSEPARLIGQTGACAAGINSSRPYGALNRRLVPIGATYLGHRHQLRPRFGGDAEAVEAGWRREVTKSRITPTTSTSMDQRHTSADEHQGCGPKAHGAVQTLLCAHAVSNLHAPRRALPPSLALFPPLLRMPR